MFIEYIKCKKHTALQRILCVSISLNLLNLEEIIAFKRRAKYFQSNGCQPVVKFAVVVKVTMNFWGKAVHAGIPSKKRTR